MPRTKYAEETIIKCCDAYRAGESVANITKKYNVPRSTLYSWIDRYRDIPDANDITVKKTLDNYKRKYEKEKQILEVLKLVECTRKAPLKTKLYELEKLYGQFSVRILCEALDVDRGTFYNHIKRNKKTDTSYAKRREELSVAIQEIYEESHGLFGSDKILAVLNKNGYHTSKKTVRELMNEMGIHSFRSRAKKDYKIWKKLHETKNVLQREFTVDKPNSVWVSDCTQFSLFKKTYHLCAILDLFSRKIIAYKISARPSTQLITSTFKMALEIRKPEGHLVFHSDRGCQYTSYSFRKLLIEKNVTQSFSKPGTPYDNGVMESFFSSFKQEEIYRTSYRSLEDCKTHIADYMQFYNKNRPHRANNYKSPNQTEEAYYKKNPAV